MAFPANKTKLVCTIGPASDSPQIIEQMILAGLNVARLNFSHGNFESHKETIKSEASQTKKDLDEDKTNKQTIEV